MQIYAVASVNYLQEEAVFGCEKELELSLKDKCTNCNGTGAKPGTSPEPVKMSWNHGQVVYTQQSMFGMVRNVQTCPDCGGTGKIIKENARLPWNRIYRKQKEDPGIYSGRYRQWTEHPYP